MTESTSIQFPIRFFLDEHFIQDLLKDKDNAVQIFMKLNFIHKNSIHYPLAHNIMLDESFLNAIKDKVIRGNALLGIIKPEQCPSHLQTEKDLTTKIIKHAVQLASKKPWKVAILTSEENNQNYLANTHYSDSVKSAISTFYGDIAFRVIEIVSKCR